MDLEKYILILKIIMTEKNESKKYKRLYVCCPVCGKILIQAEQIKDAIMKCFFCHHYICIELENDRVTAKLSKKDDKL